MILFGTSMRIHGSSCSCRVFVGGRGGFKMQYYLENKGVGYDSEGQSFLNVHSVYSVLCSEAKIDSRGFA